MTFAEILRNADIEEVKRVILWFYPFQKDSIEGYERVYDTLLGIEPQPSEMKLKIEHVKGETDPDDEYEAVSAIDLSDGESYSISHCPWAEWLGLEVSADTLEKYNINEIVAHCLYDMTFYGFDEEKIQAFRDMLNEEVENIDPREYYTFENGEFVKKICEDGN